MIVTADHGNAEQMVDPALAGRRQRTPPIPCRSSLSQNMRSPPADFKSDARRFTLRADGALQDIAPTMLGMLGVAATEGDDRS